MRAFALSLAATCLLALATPATALAQGFYAGGMLGYGAGGGETDNSGADLELDSGPFLSGFIGMRSGALRIEGELAYRENDMDEFGGIPVVGEMYSTAVMANVYYDFGPGGGYVTPYVGAGIGAVDVTFDSAVKDDDTTVAVQMMGGLAFPISQVASVTGELRAFGTEAEFTDNLGVPFDQGYYVVSLSIGLRMEF